jgi:DNA replication and repair protein RecF
MKLDTLTIIDFKNIADQRLNLSDGINCFVGDNGAGKTNILDAVHFLAMARSLSTIPDSQCVMHDKEAFLTEGKFTSDSERKEDIICSYARRGGKTLKRNGKEYDKLSDHVGHIPIVIVSPADSALISDSAEERRKYLNRFISQIDRNYMAALIRYNAALQERNKLLKNSPSEEMLLIYDNMLAQSAEVIFLERTKTIAALQPLVEHYYGILAQERETIGLEYRSDMQHTPLLEQLLQSRQKDFVNEYTSVGPHRDDIVFTIGDYPLRKFGSQGQQKSFLIALKLAEYTLLAQQSNEKPILLLDDLFDKLDMNRVAHLLRLVSGEMFGQIFITDCNKHRLERTLGEAGAEYKLFTIAEGKASTL